ncbi:MAG: T9SS type A sorting domain-containing protein [Saprospiraceae bacterium]|nr:T9SS type A sorting domain-containing protein [Saprospiraceae bacterium]
MNHRIYLNYSMVLFFLGLSMNIAMAQSEFKHDVIASSGGNLTTTSSILVYTVGEAIVKDMATTSNILSNGFHQKNLTVIRVSDFLQDPDIEVFPTLVNSELKIQDKKSTSRDLVWKVYNLQGQEISNGNSQLSQSTIQFDGVTSGIYFVHLSNKDNLKEKAIFKIIKQ